MCSSQSAVCASFARHFIGGSVGVQHSVCGLYSIQESIWSDELPSQHFTTIISGVTTYLQTHHPEGPYKMKIKTQNSYLWISLAFFGKKPQLNANNEKRGV